MVCFVLRDIKVGPSNKWYVKLSLEWLLKIKTLLSKKMRLMAFSCSLVVTKMEYATFIVTVLRLFLLHLLFNSMSTVCVPYARTVLTSCLIIHFQVNWNITLSIYKVFFLFVIKTCFVPMIVSFCCTKNEVFH